MANDKSAETNVNIDNLNGKAPTGKIGSFGGLTKDQLMNALRLMTLSREIDLKIMKLLRQGKSFFYLSAGGHEAIQTAVGLALKPGFDWGFPYYRDMTFMLALGVKPRDIFLHMLAKPTIQ
jgi:2-oxoisovalerate dehydrogenase E1 component